MPTFDDVRVSRRFVLRASAGAVGTLGAGKVRSPGGDSFAGFRRCPDATFRPETVPYDPSIHEVCSDDHPATRRIQAAVRESLETRYPTVGSLIDQGYVPYFDFVAAEGEDGWSHWINPEFIGEGSVANPKRPESILVDHEWWRPIGVMFVATLDGAHVEPPPPVYTTGEWGSEQCVPWHAHVGLPGRYAWWKYRLIYGDATWWELRRLPCRTPWMMHVWSYADVDVYAHDAPPRGYRGGPPAEPAGFETDAVPGEDLLSPAVLPDVLRRIARRWHWGS